MHTEIALCPNCGGVNAPGVVSCCNGLARIYAPPAPLTPGPDGQFDFAEVVAADTTAGSELPSTWRLHWLALALAHRLENPPVAPVPDPVGDQLLVGVLLAACRRFGVPDDHSLIAPRGPAPELLPDDPTQSPVEQLRRLALLVADACNDPHPPIHVLSATFAVGVLRGTWRRIQAQQEASREG